MSTSQAIYAGWMEIPNSAVDDLARIQVEEATLAALVSQYAGTLYRVAYSVTRNAGEAEDVVQETFLRVLRHQHRLAELRDPRVWLIRITWNLVLDRKRRNKTRPETQDVEELVRILPAGDMSADNTLISAQQHARILGLIDKLPAKEREVILLSAVEELSTVEIASVLNTTESTIRSRIFRARRALANRGRHRR